LIDNLRTQVNGYFIRDDHFFASNGAFTVFEPVSKVCIECSWLIMAVTLKFSTDNRFVLSDKFRYLFLPCFPPGVILLFRIFVPGLNVFCFS
jgi:hypothetical protein